MNLVDLVNEGGLLQDKWSLTRPKFGKDGQLEVMGWSGKVKGGQKFYVLKCSKCSQDRELFGEGYFRSVKGSLVNLSQVPCGCARSFDWSKEQYAVLCESKAKELGYTFLGFEGEWKGQKTKIKMLCEKHGEWSSGIINNLVNKDQGCPGCRADVTAVGSKKPNDVMIDSFFSSGAFHPDTEFWRSDRKDSRGKKIYWYMSCPECGEVGESISGNLQQGNRPCGCSKHRQQECYINWVVDDHNNAVAIKFGIARDSKQRVKQQDSKAAYTLTQHSVYEFPDVTSCKKAERECKQKLECGILTKEEMPDGYTETTSIRNLIKIIETYKRSGGVEK